MELTLIANLLDTKYTQVQVNNFYTQAKNLIKDPFEFVVFTTQEELDEMVETNKIKGYAMPFKIHVPKYGHEWLEIDLIQHTPKDGVSLFVTPNILLNNPEKILEYKTAGIDKCIMQDGNVAYFINNNKFVRNVLQKWEREENDLTFYNHEFKQEFQVNEMDNLPFLNSKNKEYPVSLDDPIVAFPFWYTHKVDSYIESCYNRSTDLYPYLPRALEIEICGFSIEEIKNIFTEDYTNLARMSKIVLSNDEEEPTNCKDFYDICEYLMETRNISIDLLTDLTNFDKYWWGTVGILFKNMGNITVTINDIYNREIEKQMSNAEALLQSGARVFWQYTRTTQTDEDIEKAKALSKKHKFSGFNFIENKVEEKINVVQVEEKEDLPDYKLIELETIKLRQKDAEYLDVKIKFDKQVRCLAKIENKAYIDKEGNVFPCVFTAKNILVAKINPYEETDILYDWKSNNCKATGLKKIFTNKFFTSYFTNKLKLDPSLICNKKCGVLK